MGYATSMTVSEFLSKRAYWQDGIKIVPCPEQTTGKSCVECRMCLDAGRLSAAGITIGFAAHGSGAKRLRGVLGGLNHSAHDDRMTDLAASSAVTQAGTGHE